MPYYLLGSCCGARKHQDLPTLGAEQKNRHLQLYTYKLHEDIQLIPFPPCFV